MIARINEGGFTLLELPSLVSVSQVVEEQPAIGVYYTGFIVLDLFEAVVSLQSLKVCSYSVLALCFSSLIHDCNQLLMLIPHTSFPIARTLATPLEPASVINSAALRIAISKIP